VLGLGTDDQHYPLFELGAAWTMVRVADRTPEAFLHALRTGATYFSHGPTILDVVVDGTAVEVRCSPARSVVVHQEQEYGVSVTVGANGRRVGRILETDGSGLIRRRAGPTRFAPGPAPPPTTRLERAVVAPVPLAFVARTVKRYQPRASGIRDHRVVADRGVRVVTRIRWWCRL